MQVLTLTPWMLKKMGIGAINKKVQDNIYSICLSNPPIAIRSSSQDKEQRVQQLRAKLQDLKGKRTRYLRDNKQDQCDDSTFFCNWSEIELRGLQNNNEINFV